MEDCQTSEKLNDNRFSSGTTHHQVNAVNVKEKNIACEIECELSPNGNSIVLTDNFLVNLLARDSTADAANPEKNISVENEITENAEKSCIVNDKGLIECELTVEQSQSSFVLISNAVTHDDKLEIVTEEKNPRSMETEILKSMNSENVNAKVGVLNIFQENMVVQTEQENHPKSANGEFHENSTVTNSRCGFSNAECETEVHKSAEDNMEYGDVSRSSCAEKEQSKINCEVLNQVNTLLDPNPVDSHCQKSEVEIIKEVSVQEKPNCNTEKEKSEENVSHNFCTPVSKYRCETDKWTDDDDDDSSTSDSSSDSDFFQDMCEISQPKKLPFVKTKGELGLDDLPPIEDLVISVNESEMTTIGKIYAVVEKLVVIRSMKGMKALDLESVLFLSHDQPLGRVFDVFGPVNEPFYSVRFNSVEQINEKGVKIGAEVFFAPEKSDITTYVFVEELRNQKGSDASWKHNNEPPEEFLDYSDDEKEKNAKRQRRFKNRNRQFSNNPDAPAKRPLLSDDSSNYIPPPKPAPQWNRSQNTSYRISRPNPFQTHMPPPSPSPSARSLMSPVRGQNSFGSSPNQSQRFAQPQNILYRSSPQIFISPYQQPHHVFGQVTVLNHMSPALHGPSPLPSPVMSNIPTFIPTSHFSAPQNYFNQSFSRSPSPVTHNQCMPTDPWLPNRSPSSANVPPSHPLSVQIPNLSSPPLPMHQFPGQRASVQQFVNIQNGNFNNPYVNNARNFPSANMQPRFYHS